MKKHIFLFSVICLLSMQSFRMMAQTKLQKFALDEVQLESSEFEKARQIDRKYILSLDVERLLAPYLREAGLPSYKPSYENWENTGLDGHTAGHYLSACARLYATTGDPLIKERIEVALDILERCQQAKGTGYIGGVPQGDELWKAIANGVIEADSFSLNSKWVPLYNMHKIFAGLRDLYVYNNNDKAKRILGSLCQWFDSVFGQLDETQIQEIIKCEPGGINEVLVDCSVLLNKPEYLELAFKFTDRRIVEMLEGRQNKLSGTHANTQIPKVIGMKKYADSKDFKQWDSASEYFWNIVTQNMSVSIGGNSVREHFHSPNDFTSMLQSEQGPETCNTYNMMILSELHYLSTADSRYMNYYERAMYNHILSTQHPIRGGFVYFTPMRPQHYRVYSVVENSFWCCVGTGLENHTKYNEMIYTHDDTSLYLNLFIPSQLHWKSKGMKLTFDTRFPYSDTMKLIIDEAPHTSTPIYVRIPEWVDKDAIRTSVNRSKIKIRKEEQYLRLDSRWRKGDTIEISYPMQLQSEFLPHDKDHISFLYGPIVLGAITSTEDMAGLFADESRMSHIASGKKYPIDQAPTLRYEGSQPESRITPVATDKLLFTLSLDKDKNILLQPFHTIHDARYIVYFPIYDDDAYTEKQTQIQQRERQLIEREQKIVDKVAPGEQQSESDHFFKGENTQSGVNKERFWRDATSWFGYTLKNPHHEARRLIITYFGYDDNRNFDIWINDVLIAEIKLNNIGKEVFYETIYLLPEALYNQKKLDIRFVAKSGSVAGGIYGIELIR